MAFQSVPETAQGIVKIGLSVTVTAVLTFYFKRTGGYTPQALDTLAGALDQWAGTEMRPCLSNQISYVGCEVRGLENENDYVAFSATNAGVGFVVSPVLPFNVAFAIKRLSGLTGRSARGRVYMTGIPEAWADGNALGQANADAYISALNLLNTSVFIIGWTSVIVSRFNAGVKRPVGVTFPITDWEYDNVILDTQRRRLGQY